MSFMIALQLNYMVTILHFYQQTDQLMLWNIIYKNKKMKIIVLIKYTTSYTYDSDIETQVIDSINNTNRIGIVVIQMH